MRHSVQTEPDPPQSAPGGPPFSHQPTPYQGPPPDEVLALRREFVNPAIFTCYKNPSCWWREKAGEVGNLIPLCITEALARFMLEAIDHAMAEL